MVDVPGQHNGTAFFLAGVGLVTAAHCVSGESEVDVLHPSRHATTFKVKVLHFDAHHDLAVLGHTAVPATEFYELAPATTAAAVTNAVLAVGYQTLLATMFTTTSIIFVGISLLDPELNLLAQSFASAFQSGGPLHYAVMARKEMTTIEMERWRRDFNIQFIPISKDNGYADVQSFLEVLAATKVA